MVIPADNISTFDKNTKFSIQEIYDLFLRKINYRPVCLYEKRISFKENGKTINKITLHSILEGDILNITLSLCLQGFVMWKDNIIHREEVRMSKLTYTLLKPCFPQEFMYNEVEMNKHLSEFLTFLMSDFDLVYLNEILAFLDKNPLIINRTEMKLQLEIVSKVEGFEDPRKKDIINDILACFYDKEISLNEFITKLKKGVDFNSLRKSAEEFPEVKAFLIN